MKNFLLFAYLVTLLFGTPVMAEERWCIQSAPYANMMEAMGEAKQLGQKNSRVQKGEGGYIILINEFTSEKEARTRWEEVRARLPGSIIRRCDENPSLKSTDRASELFYSAVRKRKMRDYRGALEDLRQASEANKTQDTLISQILYETAQNQLAMGDKELSQETYRKAIGKGPAYGVAPAEILFEEGYKAYKRKDFPQALRIFSQYGALYPSFRTRADYFIACCLLEMKSYRAALQIFDRIVKDYPDTPYAMESTLALGNIGLIRPRIKPPISLSNFNYLWDPISAYDEVLKKEMPIERRDQIRLSKAYGFMIMNRPEMAHKILVECLRTFPSASKAPVRLLIIRNLPAAIRAYEERKDDLGVVGVFFQYSSLNLPFPTQVSTIRSIANAMKNIGLDEEARRFLKAARVKVDKRDIAEVEKIMAEVEKPKEVKEAKSCEDYYKEYELVKTAGGEPSMALTMAVGECKFRLRDYEGCIPYYSFVAGKSKDREEKNWARLRIGQAYFRLGKKEEAGGVFSTLKAEAGEEFWMRVTEFIEAEEKWVESYRLVSRVN